MRFLRIKTELTEAEVVNICEAVSDSPLKQGACYEGRNASTD